MYSDECTMGFIARGAGQEKTAARCIAECLFASRPAPRAINPVVHKTCGTLTGLLCDVTGVLNSKFTVAFNG